MSREIGFEQAVLTALRDVEGALQGELMQSPAQREAVMLSSQEQDVWFEDGVRSLTSALSYDMPEVTKIALRRRVDTYSPQIAEIKKRFPVYPRSKRTELRRNVSNRLREA